MTRLSALRSRIALFALLAPLAPLAACSASSPSGGGPPNATAAADAGAPDDATPADAGAPTGDGMPRVPIAIHGSGGSGKILVAAVSINGSAPIDVLVDTGSVGLRVFQSSLGATAVTKSAQPVSVEFGGGVFAGHKATGAIAFGGVTTPSDTPFELVESFTCAAADPTCELASGMPKALTDLGAHGIMGIGLRADPDGLMSPFAVLGSPRSDGFTIRTGGLSSTAGEIVLGTSALAMGAAIPLVRAGSHPNGAPAWADDRVELCFEVAGKPTEPPCSDAVFDTGSNFDVLYAKNLPAALLTPDGTLASGASFQATHAASGFQMGFTVGSPAIVSKDGVIVEDTDPFTILGIEVFLRNDVAFDLAGGRIGLSPRSSP